MITTSMNEVNYSIDLDGRTTIANYNDAKPFASFFPGVAGLDGIPLWCFTTNRGQCISSFGVQNKDGGILDFSAAIDAYQRTPLLGFRTFMKVADQVYEPFRPGRCCPNQMSFTPADLCLHEENPGLGIAVDVTMMTVPGELFPALARRVVIRNTGAEPRAVEWVDGLSRIIPCGMKYDDVVHMHNTRTKMAVAEILDDGVACFHYRNIEPLGDNGPCHFALHFDESGPMPAMVDPAVVFGRDTMLDLPQTFIAGGGLNTKKQLMEGRNFTAMTAEACILQPGESVAVTGVFGYAKHRRLVPGIAARVRQPGWFESKLERNEQIVAGLTNPCATFSADRAFDHYARASFLDNTLRGGFPLTLPDASGRKQVLYVYSRIHGDMERDYNNFEIEPGFWSQGNGGYRDIGQNQRNAIYVNPDTMETSIRYYTNMIFLDGYNPHYLWGTVYEIEDNARIDAILAEAPIPSDAAEPLAEMLTGEFTPGKLLTLIAENDIHTGAGNEELLGRIIAASTPITRADPMSGFWTDHFHYNLDFIDSYLSLFPDKAQELFFEDETYQFCQGTAFVRPRSERITIEEGMPVQRNFLETDREMPPAIPVRMQGVRTKYGNGAVYRTSLFARLLALVPVKMATLDPFGIGIEFEAGKANWNDALHQMAWFFGSSSNETIQLRRLVDLLLAQLRRGDVESIRVPDEVAVLCAAVATALRETESCTDDKLFEYWDRSNAAKEEFRAATREGISGEVTAMPRAGLRDFLERCRARLTRGIEAAKDPDTGFLRSYFYHRLVEYDTVEEGGRMRVIPRRFEQRGTPQFLEGPMHYLRCVDSADAARAQYKAVRESRLYDNELDMYRISEPLNEFFASMGDACAWAPGIMENGSIWLHMEYKYLLEVLRSGLYREFFEDFRNALIPFQPPERYGRSVLENSSFLATSVTPCEEMHGQGFYARLSGATAEFHHIWLHMNCGPNPFSIDQSGELRLNLHPVLPGWLFSPEPRRATWRRDDIPVHTDLPANHYAFVLFNKTLVVYVNPARGDTVGDGAVSIRRYELTSETGETIECAASAVTGDLARRVRAGEFVTVKAYLCGVTS